MVQSFAPLWMAGPRTDNDGLLHELRSRKRIPKERRKAFDFFVILDAWCLWVERNVRVFEGRASSSTAQLGSLWSLLFSGIVN
jgi:hypothetical protein